MPCLAIPPPPFRFDFIADGKSITGMFPDAKVGAETEKLLGWGRR